MTAERTHHAAQAIQLSELLTLRFGEHALGAASPRKLVVMEADGLSTEGGRKARQSLILAPEDGEGTRIVCGWIDVARRAAEIRSFVFLNQQSQARHGELLNIARVDYDRFTQEITDLLKTQGIDVHVLNTPPRAPNAVEPKPSGKKNSMVVVAVILGSLLGLGVGYLLFGMKLLG